MFVINGEMQIGALAAFIMLIARFFGPIQQLSRFYNQLQSTMAAGEKIFELIDEPLEVEDRPDAGALPRIEGRVEFDGVTFGYNGTETCCTTFCSTWRPGSAWPWWGRPVPARRRR